MGRFVRYNIYINKMFLIFVAVFTFLVGFNVQAQMTDVGWILKPEDLETREQYVFDKKDDHDILSIYKKHEALRFKPFENLPSDFDSLIEGTQKFILATPGRSLPANEHYTGVNGERNGEGFDFSRNNLPTKIVRIAFCFGVDPIVLAGMILKESSFDRYAKSETGARGFMQITPISIREVSEQFGLIKGKDSKGRVYIGKGTVEIFNRYIQCYLGPNKRWKNMWEDGTLNIKQKIRLRKREQEATGSQYKIVDNPHLLYLGGDAISRKWLEENTLKASQWLSEDPDRNLIYGVSQFKINLAAVENGYPEAIGAYNVGQGQGHVNAVIRYRNKLRSLISQMTIENSDDGLPLTKAYYSAKVGDADSKWVSVASPQSNCVIPEKMFERDLNSAALHIMKANESGGMDYEFVESPDTEFQNIDSINGGLEKDLQVLNDLFSEWEIKGYCRTNRNRI